MTTSDTLCTDTLPFYLWDTAATPVETEEPFAGVAMMDSIFTLRPADTLRQHPSMFQRHTLAVEHGYLQPRPDTGAPAWTFIVLTLLTALLCLYYRLRKLHVGDVIASTVDSRAMERIMRGHNLMHFFQLMPMGLLMLAALAVPLHDLALTGFLNYLLLFAALVAAYLLRNALMRLLGTIFDNSAAVSLYIKNNYLYHLVLASLLTPLLFLYFYLPGAERTMLYILGILIILEFIMRVFRGMKLFLTQSSGPTFYLFYYLCTVELVPILVLIRFL